VAKPVLLHTTSLKESNSLIKTVPILPTHYSSVELNYPAGSDSSVLENNVSLEVKGKVTKVTPINLKDVNRTDSILTSFFTKIKSPRKSRAKKEDMPL